MNIEIIKTTDITPYEKNAKQHLQIQVEKIAKSISEFGFNQPLVIDKNNVIIVGHGRFEAARFLGLAEVPAIRLENLTEQQVKAYRLADNKLNESEWNLDLVIEEMAELDLKMQGLTGFNLEELKLGENQSDSFSLPDGEKSGFQQLTFTMANEQVEKLKEALKIASEHENETETFGNENSNGNALFFIINEWLTQRRYN